jgi:hypothetical protein
LIFDWRAIDSANLVAQTTYGENYSQEKINEENRYLFLPHLALALAVVKYKHFPSSAIHSGPHARRSKQKK